MEKTANATRAEIIQKARDHYQEAADSLGHWSNSIPKALDAWEREPELIERIEELEAEVRKWQERFVNLADWVVVDSDAVEAAILIHVQEARDAQEGKGDEPPPEKDTGGVRPFGHSIAHMDRGLSGADDRAKREGK